MNWLAYTFAHDVTLPGAAKSAVPFFMYPPCETTEGRLESLDPDSFKCQITALEAAIAPLLQCERPTNAAR